MRQHDRAMGIRTASARAETLGSGDVTLRGTYWYDLRARRPVAAALKRALDLIVALSVIALCAPLFFVGRTMREKRAGFRGHVFLMHTRPLHQLLNVVEGSMSLVGPRPVHSWEVESSEARRFSVRPGMTGLWRIESGEERELDRRYVNEWSVARDLMILARTEWSRRLAAPRR